MVVPAGDHTEQKIAANSMRIVIPWIEVIPWELLAYTEKIVFIIPWKNRLKNY